MGFYLQGPDPKADYLLATYPDFQEVTPIEAGLSVMDEDRAIVVVVANGPFDAAAFAFSENEFEEFTRADDPRPRRFLSGPRDLVEVLSRYRVVEEEDYAVTLEKAIAQVQREADTEEYFQDGLRPVGDN